MEKGRERIPLRREKKRGRERERENLTSILFSHFGSLMHSRHTEQFRDRFTTARLDSPMSSMSNTCGREREREGVRRGRERKEREALEVFVCEHVHKCA